MPVFSNALAGAAGSGGAADYKIERSLRFNTDDTSFLEKTFSSAGNKKKWTWSGWVKKSQITDSQQVLFSAYGGTGNAYLSLDFRHDQPRFLNWNGSTIVDEVKASAKLRDPSAWYHLVWAVDTDQSTDADKVKLYINGIRQTQFETANYPSTGDQLYISNNIVHEIGRNVGTSSAGFNGYLADVHFLDGLAPGTSTDDTNGSVTGTPGAEYLTDFGEFDADTGVWNPIKYTGSYSGPAVGSGVVYSDGVSSPQGIQSAYPATNAFDGSTSTACTNVTTNGSPTLTVTFNPPLTNVTSLRMYTGNIGSNQYATGYGLVNGTSISHSTLGASYGAGWVDFTGHFSGTTVNSMGLGQTNAGTNALGLSINAIEVNGTILTDGTPAGVNGFNLDFSDNSNDAALGNDAAGSNNWTVNNLIAQGPAATQFKVYGNASNSGSSSTINVSSLTTLQGTNVSTYNIGGTSYNHLTADLGSVGTHAIQARTYLNVGSDILVFVSNNGSSWSSISNQQDPYIFTGRYIQWVRTGQGYDNQVLTAVSAESATDSLLDSPTNYEASSGNNGGNYATLNRLQTGSGVTLSNGNLDLDGTSSWKSSYSTIFLKSGKWYTEYTIRGITTHSYGIMVGLAGLGTNSIESEIGSSGDSYAIQNGPGDMKVNYNGTSSGQGPQAAYAVGDVLQLAWNADDGKLFFGKNGTWINSANPVTGANAIRNNLTGTYCFAVSLLTAADKISANFGQLPFRHTIPTGYKSVCTQNLDDSLISNGSTAFDVLTYSGSGYPDLTNPSQSLTGLSFSPDFVWAKARSAAYSHGLFDSVRGPNKGLRTNGTNTETNDSGNSSSLVSFDSNGFTVGPDAGAGTINYGGTNYVAWAWDGGDLATNSAYNQDRVWSDGVTFSGSIIAPATNAFDGNSATSAAPYDGANGGGTPQWVQVTFSPGIPYTSSVKVERQNGNPSDVTVAMNGGTPITSTFQAYTTVATGSGTLTSIKVQNNGSSNTAGISRIEVDGKVLVDKGVIPVGSANSSAYNSGEVWSTTGTLSVDLNGSTVSNMTGPLTKAFEGSLASSSMVYEGTAYTNGTKTYTYTFGTAQTNITSARVYLYQGNSAEGGATGFGNGTINKTQDGTYGWVDASSTIPANGTVSAMTMTTTATSGVNSSRNGFIAIELNGKILLDAGVTPVDNFPSIPSTVRANPTAGFSIVTYSVPSSGTTFSVGHGLEAAPSLIIAKDRGGTNPWGIYHSALGAGKGLLFTTAGEQVNSNWWNNTNPTSTLFYLNTGIYAHSQPGNDYVAYCFAPVAGYSAFGSYTGNGSANGTFVYTGFRPAFLMVKGNNNYDGGGTIVNGYNWFMYDSERSAYNLNDDLLAANKNFIEESNAGVDFLSNGFKMRNVNAPNANYTQYYIAFAENPFKIARAR